MPGRSLPERRAPADGGLPGENEAELPKGIIDIVACGPSVRAADRAAAAIETYITSGPEKAMNQYN